MDGRRLNGCSLNGRECCGCECGLHEHLENSGGLRGCGRSGDAAAEEGYRQRTGEVGVDRRGRCARTEQRRAAVVTRVIDAELSIVQAGRQHARGDAVLVVVRTFPIGVARDGAQRPVVGEGAEAEQDIAAAPGRKIIGGEIGADGFEFIAAEFQQPERFHGDVFRHADRGLHEVDGQQGFFEFGTGGAELGEIGGIDDIDAVGDERAFAEAEHLAPNAELDGHGRADGKFRPRIHVEELGTADHAVFRLIGKFCAQRVIALEVGEPVAADEGAEVAVFEL